MVTRRAPPIARWSPLAGLAVVAILAPLLFAGPGTDLDTGAVIQSGRAILHGDYTASRAPGSPVHEAIVGVLERIGGTTLSNIGSLAMAVVLCVAIATLLRRNGVPHAELAVAFVVANPWFQIAATSTVDFIWAVALLLCGVIALRSGHPVVAGLLFALAIGCRMSTAILVGAALVAEAVGAAARRRAAVTSGLVALLGSVLLYLPPFFAAGSTLAFAQNDFRTASPAVHLGRALAKLLYFFGPYAAVGLCFALPSVGCALRQWRTNWMVRFAAVGAGASVLLFIRFPWKMGHLIPLLLCVALLLAVALARRPHLLAALVALELLFGIVNVEVVQPNSQNSATAARFVWNVKWGPLIVDARCRRDDEHAWVGNDQARLEAVWNCAKPFGTGR
ncbi:MAG TPA: hypothetical protein VGQ20_14435 [Acidimicrobiales bacterium]|jgi:hypothetical protein|nr:hypothetical protein [Acidimicrobiales bacterium]